MKLTKTIALVLALVLCVGLFSGCGASGYTAKNTEYVIGLSGPLTGAAAVYGVAVQNSAQMAIDEINAAGGVNGKKLVVISADNKSEAAEAVNAATKLISDDKVKVIVGPAVTANVIAESQVATDNKVPVIAPDATSPDVTVENGQVKPFIFRS